MNIRIHGKCILAGEHSVVRGKAALVTPLFSRALEITLGKSSGPFQNALHKAIAKAQELTGKKLESNFTVRSDIPPSAGMGSSAALSVAVARLFVPEKECFALALELENIFHGTSSGIDVAAVCAEGPILFRKGTAPLPLDFPWRPYFYLSDTGLRSSTKACVEKVAAQNRPDLDERMEAAVFTLKSALEAGSLPKAAEAMQEAEACFDAWGLIPDQVRAQAQELKQAGALAVKPTGSGDGGFLLSLWEKPAPAGLIPIWGS